MEQVEILVLVLSFLILLTLGVPVAFSLGLSGLFTLIIAMDTLTALTTLAQRIGTAVDSFTLLAIPFFILAGQLMNQGGIARRLIDFAKALVGSFPGGLAFVNILACMLFGAIAGSAVASASAIGGSMVERMENEGYPRPFSAAVNITASTTGLIIPPSNILIVYALASGGLSIGALFLAGYVPGIIMGASLMVVAGWLSKKYEIGHGEKFNFKTLWVTFWGAMPSLTLLIIVIGGIVIGFFTATEASAVAVFYTLVLILIYKEINFKRLVKAILETVNTTAIVLFLVGTSMALSWVMSYEYIPQNFTQFMLGISDHPIIILLLINAILLFIGIFMDMTPAVLIFTPIFLPVVVELGMDPVHFGIVMVTNLCIGLCTPPVGTVLFVGCGIAGIKIEQVLKPLLPFFIALLISLLAITFVPELSLWLPRLFGF